MNKGKVTFRVEPDEMRELIAEGRDRGSSPDEAARARMRAYARLRESHEALAREVTELRRENSRNKYLLANVCKVLLCRAGKESEAAAEAWVREHLLK